MGWFIDRYWCYAVALWAALMLGSVLGSCDFPAGTVEGSDESTSEVPFMDSVQDPLHGRSGAPYYRGRGFLADGDHLGWDLLLPEGRPIYPIGRGVVRLARSARGYGTMAVVLEHRLPSPVSFINGAGARVTVDRFLSIYGHLRPTRARGGADTEPLRPGTVVSPDRVIGYVENGALNGDGEEHLHLGIRLQDMEAAQGSDPSAWFRGYDAVPSQRRWFSDPEDVLDRLEAAFGQPSTSRFDGGFVSDAPAVADRSIVPRDSGSGNVISRDVLDADQAGFVPDRPTAPPAPPVPDASAPTPVPEPDASAPPPPPPLPPPSADPVYRYEFRVRSSLWVTPPYRLRDLWWRPQVCRNTGTVEPAVLADGWIRCEAARMAIFDGSVFLPDHPGWGDAGQIGTVGNAPDRCTPTAGAEWRISDASNGRILFSGPASALRCVHVDTQDRWAFPDG